MRTIRKISICKLLKGWKFLGLRLIDEKGDYIVDEIWGTFRPTPSLAEADLSWETWVVPDGEEIAGLQFSFEQRIDYIKMLGF